MQVKFFNILCCTWRPIEDFVPELTLIYYHKITKFDLRKVKGLHDADWLWQPFLIESTTNVFSVDSCTSNKKFLRISLQFHQWFMRYFANRERNYFFPPIIVKEDKNKRTQSGNLQIVL